MKNVSSDATVEFLGSKFSQVGFTWGVRGFLLAASLILIGAVFFAWRKGDPANIGVTTHKQNMPVGDSDEEIRED
ncbi:MAG: sodium:calcium symporter, partial [Fibrobacter sp.]|nr:sodium:calcium symporter [Fibrobacter sp.]